MVEQMPEWADGVRAVAAAVLAGQSDEEGMRVLVEEQRAHGVPWEATLGACTEKALPFWQRLLKDEDAGVRSWAAQALKAVSGGTD